MFISDIHTSSFLEKELIMFWARFFCVVAFLGLPVMFAGFLASSILARDLPVMAGPSMLFVGFALFFGGGYLERRTTPKWFLEQSAV